MSFKILSGVLLAMGFLFSSLSCNNDGDKKIIVDPPAEDEDDDSKAPGGEENVYVNVIDPLMGRYCLGAGCHSRPEPADGVALDFEAGVLIHAEDVLEEIKSGRMPIDDRPKLLDFEIIQIESWVIDELGPIDPFDPIEDEDDEDDEEDEDDDYDDEYEYYRFLDNGHGIIR